MKRNKLKLTDIKVGMVITYIADLKDKIEILSGRVETIEKWNFSDHYRLVLTVGDSENKACETIFADINDFRTTFVEGVL